MSERHRPSRRGKRHGEADKRSHPVRNRVIAFAAGAVGLAGVGTGYYELHRPMSAVNTGPQVKPIQVKKTTPVMRRTNILLIGTDARPRETGGNTDVLILCSIDPQHKRIALMSIPRDTKVHLPDGSTGKINAALRLGGPQATAHTVSTLLDQPIDYYALTHFGGLVDVINTVHGITLDVPEPMHYNTGDHKWNIINLKPGVQTLNGVQALGFVRFRDDPLGDIGRTERQQEFLSALAHKLLRPANIAKLPTLVREFHDTVQTNMNPLTVLNLTRQADQFKSWPIIHETLPGSFHNPNPNTPGDLSYWMVNPREAKWAANQLFHQGVVQVNPIQAPSVTATWTPPVQQPRPTQRGPRR